MEFINKYKYYLIFGVIFLLGIILIIIGSGNEKTGENISELTDTDKMYYIDLIGDNEITIYKGEEYVDPGYRGYDENNNDLTSEVEVTSDINTDIVGTYKVFYSLKDIVKERHVEVIKKEPGATYIHLYGDVNTFLYVGEEYVEKGYEVIDTVDGDMLKDKVKVTNNVDTSKAGVYKVSYVVTNSSEIITTVVRTVVVMNSEMSLSQENTNYTNGNVKINVYIDDDMLDYLLLPNGKKVNEKIYTYEVSENGTYKFVMYNKKGKNITKSLTINNINRTKPSGSCSGIYKDGKSTINIKANDDIGISRYEIDGKSYTTNQITISKKIDIAKIAIYDKANNKSEISCDLREKIKSGSYKVEDWPLSYYVYVPPEATTNMPLLVWLHGDNPREEWVKSDRLGEVGYNSGNPFILVKPYAGRHFGNTEKGGYAGWAEGGLLSSVKSIVDFVCEQYKCDKKNINIGGHSRGAIGTWIMVSIYPGYFHAAAPISCCAFYREFNPSSFRGVKVWAIRGSGAGQGDQNDDIYAGCMASNVSAVKEYAKDVKYTILPNTDHGSATDNLDGEFFKYLITD